MRGRTIQVLSYVAISGIAWTVAGFLIGALLGIAMTWHNNNILPDAPQGSYLFWGRFTGLYATAIALPIGLFVGLMIGLSRTDKQAS